MPPDEPPLSDEKPPNDNPAAEVAVADSAPELVDAEELVLVAVALALVAVALAVKTTSWLGVTAGFWTAFKEGSDTPPAPAWRACARPREGPPRPVARRSDGR